MLFNQLLMIQIFASVIMLLFWVIQLKTKDASLVDLVWSSSIFIAIVYLYFNLEFFDVRHITIALLGVFWSLRLSLYLWARIRRGKAEDRRYKAMRASMGNYAQSGFFIFYQAQALFVTIFTTPIAIALMTTSKTVSLLDAVGIIVFIVAILGESIADRQLMHFKESNKGKQITCNTGLWYYSRHPNYFFEWIHWFAYLFFSYESQYFLVTCIAPFVMLIFLLKLTGIPHIEREALKNKPDYKAYMEKTSTFIPWFKR